jgi:hypothetical protein
MQSDKVDIYIDNANQEYTRLVEERFKDKIK